MHPDRLVELYPTVYHMAEAGTWDSIRKRGLMSASATLDHFKVTGAARAELEGGHRPAKAAVTPGNPAAIILRDQIPMPPERLLRALGDRTTPEEWYRLINGKVFFWAQHHRLERLLNARQYRNLEHDVLTVDTRCLVAAHGEEMWLCHMNSGNTFPMPFRRGPEIFRRIPNYPVNRNNNPTPDVVEVLVDYAVPDIAHFVTEVRRMRGSEVLCRIG